MDTLLAHLLDIAGEYPDRTALRCGVESLSYGELQRRILGTAEYLHGFGVEPSDRVVICCGNTLAFPVLYFAVHALGATAVPVALDTPDGTLAFLANDADARLVISQKVVDGLPCPCIDPGAAVQAGDGSEIEIQCNPATRADLLYTTGTTGRRKGVVLTQANILAAARNITAFIDNRPDDLEIVPIPLSHSFGLGRLRCMALIGHALILEPHVGTGAAVVQRAIETQASGLVLVPTGFDIIRRMTGDTLGRTQEHLRYIELGSAPMRQETRQWLMRLLPKTRICHHYGLTEASRAAFTEYHRDVHKHGTAGRPAPNVEIVVCDDFGRTISTGELGEIVVRGKMVMQEYWKQPELTRETLGVEGLRTGDIGYVDDDGYLFLLGRRHDVINVGGRKVVPDEVEDLLCQMEGIRDAGCVAEPDPLLGECVKAYVVADREIRKAEIVAFLRARLEECKIPQMVERIASIPRTTSGKIQRQLLRSAETQHGH